MKWVMEFSCWPDAVQQNSTFAEKGLKASYSFQWNGHGPWCSVDSVTVRSMVHVLPTFWGKGQRIDAKATKSTGLLEDVELLVKATWMEILPVKKTHRHGDTCKTKQLGVIDFCGLKWWWAKSLFHLGPSWSAHDLQGFCYQGGSSTELQWCWILLNSSRTICKTLALQVF